MTTPHEDEHAEGINSPERLHPRAARIKLAEAQDYLAHLEVARRAKLRLDGATASLDDEIVRARNAVVRLGEAANARIEQRRRTLGKPVPAVEPRPECMLFLDECGNHNLSPERDPFPVFCLCGIIVAAERYDAFDALWKGWKARWLGSPHTRVHEPDVRHRSHTFYRKDASEQQNLLESLEQQLAELDFACVAAAVDKRRFAERYPTGTVDDFLPKSTYLMCVDFVFERFVHYLCFGAGDARGLTQAESRGPREDAEVHAEFLRLHLEGTQWQSEQQFRHALRPYIEFRRKDGDLKWFRGRGSRCTANCGKGVATRNDPRPVARSGTKNLRRGEG